MPQAVFSGLLKAFSGIVRSQGRKEWRFAQGLLPTVKNNWYLGFTSFGGPPVHFQIVSSQHDLGTHSDDWIVP